MLRFLSSLQAILRRGGRLQLSSSLIFRIQMAPSADGGKVGRQAAAQRLGLAAGEHGAKLTPIRTAFAPTVRSRACHVREARFEPDITMRATIALHAQPHIRSPLSDGTAAPIFRFRRAGSGGRDHSLQRRCLPRLASVRPPGFSGTDQAPKKLEDSIRLLLKSRPRSRRPGLRIARERLSAYAPGQRSLPS
jgi:hypothetical protein